MCVCDDTYDDVYMTVYICDDVLVYSMIFQDFKNQITPYQYPEYDVAVISRFKNQIRVVDEIKITNKKIKSEYRIHDDV